jgi:putative endonuclease
MLFGAFQPPSRTGRARHGLSLLYFEGYEDIRTAIAREKQLKGWRRAKKLNLIRTINPEFKDLARTWGWKMITVHEKMYP